MLKLFGSGKPDHPFADPREARRLLAELPEHDAMKALEELAHWHESVAAAEGFKPEARVQALFLIDEAAQPRLRKVAREYFAASRPSRYLESRLWTHVHDYCRQAGLAYARAVDAVLQAGKAGEAAKPLLPLLAVRTLRSLAQQLKWLHLRYGPVDPSVWRVLNGVFAFAESRGVADTRAAPVYPGVAGDSTPRIEFLRALMLSVSSPDSLLPVEVDAAERLIAELASRFAMGAAPAGGLTHWTDLGQAMPPRRLVRAPEPGAGLRYFGAAAALQALQQMAERVRATGEPPATLAGGGLADGEAVLGLLSHLALYWGPGAPERQHPRHAVKSRLSIVHGLGAVVGALSGSESLDFSPQAAENWIVENVSAGGFGAIVPAAKGDWLKIGVLLAMQPDGGNNWIIGMIRRVSKTATNEARVGIQTLSRAPALVRFSARGVDETGVLLPAPGLGTGETAIALRSGFFTAGQNLEAERGGKSYMYLPQGVAERGEDYDLVRFREMIREG